MQIVTNAFWENKKPVLNLSSAKLDQRVVKVNVSPIRNRHELMVQRLSTGQEAQVSNLLRSHVSHSIPVV